MKTSGSLLFLIAFVLLGLGVGPAQAQTGHMYIGASAGSTSFDTGITALTASLDDSSTGFKVYGGYNLSPNVAVELSYADLGSAEVTGNIGDRFIADGYLFEFTVNNAHIKFEGTLVGAGARFRLPVSRTFNIHARLGLASWNVDTTAYAPGVPGASSSNSGTDPYYGAGVGWEFVPTVYLTADFEHYELDTESADLISVGIAKRF
ncbi:MAG TPA: porin family protein [Gammaproteobacteria bacterium]|nr:porin family protein [Gammaproteobacteria bacterium]